MQLVLYIMTTAYDAKARVYTSGTKAQGEACMDAQPSVTVLEFSRGVVFTLAAKRWADGVNVTVDIKQRDAISSAQVRRLHKPYKRLSATWRHRSEPVRE